MATVHHSDLLVGREFWAVLFYLYRNAMSLHETEEPINPSPLLSTQEKNKPALELMPKKAVSGVGSADAYLTVPENQCCNIAILS